MRERVYTAHLVWDDALSLHLPPIACSSTVHWPLMLHLAPQGHSSSLVVHRTTTLKRHRFLLALPASWTAPYDLCDTTASTLTKCAFMKPLSRRLDMGGFVWPWQMLCVKSVTCAQLWAVRHITNPALPWTHESVTGVFIQFPKMALQAWACLRELDCHLFTPVDAAWFVGQLILRQHTPNFGSLQANQLSLEVVFSYSESNLLIHTCLQTVIHMSTDSNSWPALCTPPVH